ncbi:MAG: hypothetical protein ACRDJM_01740, partial [Actinomycetota bacterium]
MPPHRVRALGLAAAVALLAVCVPAASGAFTLSSNAGGRLIAPGRTGASAISDGAGGAIVASRDPTTATAVLNRYAPDGSALWAQGLSFAGATGIEIAPDGAGGVIVGVPDDASPGMIVGRILHSGATTWQATFPSGVLASGGDGGAWVVSQGGELFVDGITAAGVLRPRVQLSAESLGSESFPAAIGDGAGGAYFAWRVATGGEQFALRLQHIDAGGAMWPQAADVAGSSESGIAPHLSPDGRGGVLVSWHAAGQMWVHDYGIDGAPAWERVLTLSGASPQFHIAAAGGPGAYVVWTRRLRAEPLPVDMLSVTYVENGAARWTRNLDSVDGGVLDVRAVSQAGGAALAVGWQSAQLPVVGPAVDPDLSIARVTAAGFGAYGLDGAKPLATSLGPDTFGALVDGGGGSVVAVFTQSPCLRGDASGVAMQR